MHSAAGHGQAAAAAMLMYVGLADETMTDMSGETARDLAVLAGVAPQLDLARKVALLNSVPIPQSARSCTKCAQYSGMRLYCTARKSRRHVVLLRPCHLVFDLCTLLGMTPRILQRVRIGMMLFTGCC